MSSSRRHHALLALVGVVLAGVLPAAPCGASAGATAPPAGVVSARRGQGIDTSDKDEVSRAWRHRMAANAYVASGWSGSVHGCEAGRASNDAQDATLESVNFARAMAGLDAVGLDHALSREAQEAALIMSANSALSHDPSRSWHCWSRTGADAAGHSNLASTAGPMTAGQSVELYLDDAGSSNRDAGHRRWVLNPFATEIGNGLTATTDALYVVGPTDVEATNPDWVSWPTAGWFPGQLQPGGRWSLSSGASGADFSHATVRVQRGSQSLHVRRFRPRDGYGQPTLVFQVADAAETGGYRVVVRHIRGAAATRHAWTVRLFNP
jgi:uncharacterized protein YkwD